MINYIDIFKRLHFNIKYVITNKHDIDIHHKAIIISTNYGIDQFIYEYNAKESRGDRKLRNLLLDVAFYLTPACVKNFFIRSYALKFGVEPKSDEKLYNVIFERYYNYKEDSIKHISEVYVSMNTTFHPYINKTLLANFDAACNIFIGKLLDDNDDYFNVDTKQANVTIERINNIVNRNFSLIKLIEEYGGALAGSVALAHYGSVYRDKIHDLDFVLPLDCLSLELINLIEETSKLSVMTKEKRDKEKVVPQLFKETNLYKDLYKLANGNIKIKDFNIDQICEYDKVARGVIILDFNGIDVDLIFRNEVHKEGFTNLINRSEYYCQSLEDSIATKKLLGRPKDFQDLINF